MGGHPLIVLNVAMSLPGYQAVSSSDSRTILDSNGAKNTGRGDMPVRVEEYDSEVELRNRKRMMRP